MEKERKKVARAKTFAEMLSPKFKGVTERELEILKTSLINDIAKVLMEFRDSTIKALEEIRYEIAIGNEEILEKDEND